MRYLTNLTGLASLLVQAKWLDEQQAKYAVQQSQLLGVALTHYLVKNHLLDSESIARCCVDALRLPIIDLRDFDQTILQSSPIPIELMQRYHVLPLSQKNDVLQLGMTDPTDQTAIDVVSFHTGLTIIPCLIRENELTQLFETHCSQLSFIKELELALNNECSQEESLTINENIVNYDEPVIQLVDHLIKRALQDSASDIHIEPYETECRLRYRKDGILYEMTTISGNIATRLITRLKVMSKMDIAERRLPQDGRLHLHATDIRINTCPTLFGEKIVLRLMDPNKHFLDIHTLGLNQSQQKIFLKKISQPQGLILVTGPTGSGKTVTLYSALRQLNTAEKNISTVEDPIEIQLQGINQVNIHPKIGLDFATVLRTFLRQDPDILMVGEIRDKETADIAIQAAQTGHLVFSTLHTNSAAETLTRLQSMGVAPYNMAHSISLIIAQRLIRKLCIHCRTPDKLPHPLREKYQLHGAIFRPRGCDQCLQGYEGRSGIYEFLPINETVSRSLLSGTSVTALHDIMQHEKLPTLLDQGLEKIREGHTSLAEINRVLQL